VLTREEFRARDLFEGLYAGHVESALESGYAALLSPGEKRLRGSILKNTLTDIVVRFICLAAQKPQKGVTENWALEQHKENLNKLHHRLVGSKVLISAKICISCLTGPPQHVLGCGHTLCDQCALRFGNAVIGEESCYLVETCAICQETVNFKIYLKPATAGVRMLNIDGGGVRGVVPLVFLARLQEELGAPIQDFFDIAFGTSAGKM
jgi:hypothetical protein